MALMEIVTFPDPSLRLKAKPVKKFDKESNPVFFLSPEECPDLCKFHW